MSEVTSISFLIDSYPIDETKKTYLPAGMCSNLKYPDSLEAVPETKVESTARINPTFTKGNLLLLELSTKTPLMLFCENKMCICTNNIATNNNARFIVIYF